MTTNREWLYSLDVADLSEWFDAEHVEDANGASDGARAALDAKNDSRAKLESEVRIIAEINEDDEKGRRLFEDMIIELLDRQAAITQAECERICDTCEWPSLAAQPDQEAYDRIAELEAERDELADDLLACNRERDHYRELFSEALTLAAEIVNLQP